MCATTESPPKGSPASPPSPPTTSSFMTPISIRKHHDRNVPPTPRSNSIFAYDTPQTAASTPPPPSVPTPIQTRARRPSVVLSDDGLDEDQYHLDSSSDHGTVDNPSSFCAQMIMLPAVCQGDQLDIFMACRHPLDLLGMSSPEDLGEASEYNASSNSGSHRVSGYHALSTACEYCGSLDITKCSDDCQRPRSFFPKKRPPFCPKGGSDWDVKDFYIDTGDNKDKQDTKVADDIAKSEASAPKWTLWDDIRQ